ncbi:hypothetical protein JCGZ_04222 [Jatropha curcas]|uniref:Uncharacterized protein n=1 Tax=Jatropha curcas TaxID=180498 RepID=A0A067L662_JATCU|nr:hypothetical protein JCGZ_04222 [Jatropha curcas]
MPIQGSRTTVYGLNAFGHPGRHSPAYTVTSSAGDTRTIGPRPYSVHRAPSLWRHQSLSLDLMPAPSSLGPGPASRPRGGGEHYAGSPLSYSRDAGLTPLHAPPLKRIDDLIDRAAPSLGFSSSLFLVLSFPMK